MNNTLEIGKKLVSLCKEGRFDEAMSTLYARDIVSVEAGAPQGQDREARGLDACIAKGKWWSDNHIVHSAEIEGPWPHDDKFIVRFKFDITSKPMNNQRIMMDEVGLYTVKDGKIVREEFFYSM
jgi:hypothetical protein